MSAMAEPWGDNTASRLVLLGVKPTLDADGHFRKKT